MSKPEMYVLLQSAIVKTRLDTHATTKHVESKKATLMKKTLIQMEQRTG